jgi:hypothetical protein
MIFMTGVYVVAMTTQRSEPPIVVTDLLGFAASISRDVAEIGVRLLDDAYMTWLIAESEAEQTLEAWREQSSGTRASRFRAYLAATEREEAAARDLQRLSEIASAYPVRDSFVLPSVDGPAEDASIAVPDTRS